MRQRSRATLIPVFAKILFLTAAALLGGPSFADETPFHDESEAGIVVTSGNSTSQSFNLKQLSAYTWNKNLLKLNGKYLDASQDGQNTARSWNLGLRYERELSDRFSAFLGQDIEGDDFAGYRQRYNTDVGGKYFIYKQAAFNWTTEAGYRYTIENRLAGQFKQNYLRFYTEANRDWTKTFSTKADVECLPNLSVSSDYQLNGELALSAALNETFAVKTGYVVKYRHLPPPPATKTTDTQFTTALVAKF